MSVYHALLPDSRWVRPVAQVSWCHAFPGMMGCTLKQWAKASTFFPKSHLSKCVLPAIGKATDEERKVEKCAILTCAPLSILANGGNQSPDVINFFSLTLLPNGNHSLSCPGVEAELCIRWQLCLPRTTQIFFLQCLEDLEPNLTKSTRPPKEKSFLSPAWSALERTMALESGLLAEAEAVWLMGTVGLTCWRKNSETYMEWEKPVLPPMGMQICSKENLTPSKHELLGAFRNLLLAT